VIIVLMGVSGCGKSTIGGLLAGRLGWPLAEGDDLHPAANVAKMAAGHPLTDSDRWPWLARLADWLRGEPEGAVLACSALRHSYRDVLRTASDKLCFLHLAGSADVVTVRVGHRLNHYMPASLVDSQYATLEPLGADEFGVAIDFTLPPEQIVEQFLKEVQ
jgi:gluconokinase